MKYIALFSFLIFFGCSSQKERPEEKIYSDDTNQAFDMIERGGSYYLKKPEPKTTAPQIKKAKVTKVKSKKNEPPPQVDERLIEINQNLAFYCMKHRKNSKFSGSEEKCMVFVNKSLKECQSKHSDASKKLLSCIQKKLNRR